MKQPTDAEVDADLRTTFGAALTHDPYAKWSDSDLRQAWRDGYDEGLTAAARQNEKGMSADRQPTTVTTTLDYCGAEPVIVIETHEGLEITLGLGHAIDAALTILSLADDAA